MFTSVSTPCLHLSTLGHSVFTSVYSVSNLDTVFTSVYSVSTLGHLVFTSVYSVSTLGHSVFTSRYSVSTTWTLSVYICVLRV